MPEIPEVGGPDVPAEDAAGAGADTTGDEEVPTGPGIVRGLPEPVMNTERGGVGLFYTTLPEFGGPLTFRFRLHTSFFRKKGFLYEVQPTDPMQDTSAPWFDPDQHSRVAGGVTLGFTPWKYIETFFSINSQSNRNVRVQPPGTPRQDPETQFALGDIDFGLKGGYRFKDGGVGLAGQFGLGLLSGTKKLGPQAVNLWFDVLFAVDLRYLTEKAVPVRIAANLGWYRDQSLELVDWENITDSMSREVTRFALGANHDRVRMRYGLDFPVRLGKEKQYGIDPILEWSWDVSTEKDDRFAQPMSASSPFPRSSHWLTIGLRSNVISGLFLDAAVDVGLNSPDFVYGPPVPPWQVILGLGWSVDPHPQIKKVEVPVEETADVGPPPVLEGRIVGRILGPDGAPVGGVRVEFPGLAPNAVLAGEDGTFTSFRFPEGTVAVRVTDAADPSKVLWEGSAEVKNGEDTNLEIQLEQAAAATGIVQGAFTGPDGKGLKVTVHVVGQGVDEPFESTEDGLIALELYEGSYRAKVTAPGMREKEITFDVEAGKEISVSAALEADKPPETPNVKASSKSIRLRKKIRYQGTDVAPSSYPILDELATFLKYHPEYAKIRIGVHTDDRGNPMARSKARAEAVKAYLVGKGIAPERIVAKGYGDKKPVAVNLTAEGRRKNNRTTIRVLEYNPAP